MTGHDFVQLNELTIETRSGMVCPPGSAGIRCRSGWDILRQLENKLNFLLRVGLG